MLGGSPGRKVVTSRFVQDMSTISEVILSARCESDPGGLVYYRSAGRYCVGDEPPRLCC